MVDEPLPPRHRIERRAIGWWAVRALTGTAVIGGLLVAGYLLFGPARPWLTPVLIATAVVGLTELVVVPPWRYAVHRWEVTEQAVYVRTGWFVREWRIAPLSRVQTVDTVRGPLQQALGLATVTVTTASAQGAIRIDGLDRRTADTVTRDLTEITQATPGDAT